VNTTDYKLLASEGVSVVCDNRYIGKSSLPQTIVPREIFDVYFGADPAIKVCTEHYSVISTAISLTSCAMLLLLLLHLQLLATLSAYV
jgi:hypothetical protein